MSGLRRIVARWRAPCGRAVADEADDVVEGRVVAQLECVVAFDPVGLADWANSSACLTVSMPEVGFEVEVEVEQFGRVAGLLGDQRHHPSRQILLHDLASSVSATATDSAPDRPCCGGSSPGGGCRWGAVADEADDVVEGRVVAQLQ